MLFKFGSDGKLYFNDRSKKHSGKPVEMVARTDPKYVQWARRDGTLGAPQELTDKLDEVMETNGVAFTRRTTRKKKP